MSVYREPGRLLSEEERQELVGREAERIGRVCRCRGVCMCNLNRLLRRLYGVQNP